MRSLALLLAVSWFWILFYGVGPLDTAAQLLAGGVALAVSCAAAGLAGRLLIKREGHRRLHPARPSRVRKPLPTASDL